MRLHDDSHHGQRLLKAAAAAKYLGISERTLWTLSSVGRIPTVRFGDGDRKSVRYDVVDLDSWIDSRKRGGGAS